MLFHHRGADLADGLAVLPRQAVQVAQQLHPLGLGHAARRDPHRVPVQHRLHLERRQVTRRPGGVGGGQVLGQLQQLRLGGVAAVAVVRLVPEEQAHPRTVGRAGGDVLHLAVQQIHRGDARVLHEYLREVRAAAQPAFHDLMYGALR